MDGRKFGLATDISPNTLENPPKELSGAGDRSIYRLSDAMAAETSVRILEVLQCSGKHTHTCAERRMTHSHALPAGSITPLLGKGWFAFFSAASALRSVSRTDCIGSAVGAAGAGSVTFASGIEPLELFAFWRAHADDQSPTHIHATRTHTRQERATGPKYFLERIQGVRKCLWLPYDCLHSHSLQSPCIMAPLLI